MITLHADLLTGILSDVLHIAHLYKIEFTGGTQYLTDCDQNVWYGGQEYTAYNIKFEDFRLGQKPEESGLTLELGNVNKTWSAWVLSEEIRDKKVTITRVFLDINLAVIGAGVVIFIGYTDQGVIDKRVAKIEVYTQFIKWKTMTPRRIHQDTCTWKKFKGTECAYVNDAAKTITVTIASPAVVTLTAHALIAETPIKFATTDTLPTGIVAGTTYYVISAGLAADSFRFSATLNGAAVNTSGSQAGTHTVTAYQIWCDRAYERCVILGNDLNYGGFRFLKGLATKEIWWGRMQKSFKNVGP